MGLFRVGLVVLRIGLGLIALEFWKVVFGFLLKLLVRGSHKCKQVQIMCSTGGFATFLAGGAALGKVQHLAQKENKHIWSVVGIAFSWFRHVMKRNSSEELLDKKLCFLSGRSN